MIVGRPLIRLMETGSTMDLASRLAVEGATPGTTVLAGLQTAGRGRAGRTWTTAPNASILMSFVAHTQWRRHEIGQLSLLLGLAVARTVDRHTGAVSAIKWPNDVLADGRKIAGVLATSTSLPDRNDLSLVVGVGLNVNDTASSLPATATSLAETSHASHAIDDVFTTLTGNLTDVMECFERSELDGPWREVVDRLAYRGELVRVQDGSRRHEGVLQGVSEGGLLVLRLESGETVDIAAGDLSRGPVTVG